MFSSVSSLGLQGARKLGLANVLTYVLTYVLTTPAALTLTAALMVSSALSTSAHAKAVPETGNAVTETVGLVNLPKEAQTTARLIRTGGPFPHAKDGVVFGNRERILPKQQRGFYREYTVITPGARNRGARRIVCGGAVAVNPEACYYSDDHYASFRLMVP